MWPSMWIFDRCACFPYLHPSYTLTLSHYRHLSLCLSLALSFSSLCQISRISPGSCSSIMAKAKKKKKRKKERKGKRKRRSRSLSPLHSVLSYALSSEHLINFTSICKHPHNVSHEHIPDDDSALVMCTWRPTLRPPLNPLPIMIFDLPVDHETLSSHLLPQEPQETGSCDTVVCAAMERPITAVTWQVSTGTDATMWALFSNKLQLPRGPW